MVVLGEEERKLAFVLNWLHGFKDDLVNFREWVKGEIGYTAQSIEFEMENGLFLKIWVNFTQFVGFH